MYIILISIFIYIKPLDPSDGSYVLPKHWSKLNNE